MEKQNKSENIKRYLFFLIVVTTILRAIIAGILEFGNDEVYYWMYALYPDLSHFDHPPMVGYFIQLFSLNLIFDSELFIRMSGVLTGAVNTYIVFLIGKKIKDEKTGLISAILYNASIYCFLIANVFIMPDTPMLFFWLLAFKLFIDVFSGDIITKSAKNKILICGVIIGLAMLSKYHSAFLWFGAGLYILLYKREWLKFYQLYLAVFLTLIVFSPVVIWNIQNNFISFTFQGERVDILKSGINFTTFAQEFFGQIFYNNPFNYVLIVLSIIALFKKKFTMPLYAKRLILLTALPMIFIFLLFSLFRQTLPHWTGPAYTLLLFIVSSKLSDKLSTIKFFKPVSANISFLFLILLLLIAILQVKSGILPLDKNTEDKKLGSTDITLDMYGWKQLKEKFQPIYEKDIATGEIKKDVSLIAFRWFPAANLDYYVARPMNLKLFAIGELGRIHKYYWINKIRGNIKQGSDAYFFAFSRDYKDPNELYKGLFEKIISSDTIIITRMGKPAYNVFVFKMKNLITLP